MLLVPYSFWNFNGSCCKVLVLIGIMVQLTATTAFGKGFGVLMRCLVVSQRFWLGVELC